MATFVRLSGLLLPLYFAWEMAQMPGFTSLPKDWFLSTAWCLLATVGDIAMVAGLHGLNAYLPASAALSRHRDRVPDADQA